MGTSTSLDPVAAALFGKTRRAVLCLFFRRPDESFYLREVVRATGAGQGTVQRELNRLTKSGILRRSRRGPQVFFQVNPDCPVFDELRRIVVKTVGFVAVLREALRPIDARIRVAFVYGSVARGTHTRSSDVDLCVIGDVQFAEVVAQVAPVQAELGREVNPTVYGTEEFRQKLATGQHFVTRLIEEPRQFIVGDEREFERLGA